MPGVLVVVQDRELGLVCQGGNGYYVSVRDVSCSPITLSDFDTHASTTFADAAEARMANETNKDAARMVSCVCMRVVGRWVLGLSSSRQW